MGIKFYLLLSNTFILIFSPFCFAQYQPIKNSSSWDYSLGGSKKFDKPYTSLRQLERNVYTYPIPQEESNMPQSPLGRDYYTYILPQKIINITLIEVEFIPQQKGVEIQAEKLAREIERAMPIIMKAAIEKLKKTGEETQRYLIRVKKAPPAAETSTKGETEEESAAEQETQKTSPQEEEIDVLVRVLFGGEKVVIKIPPLKDPKEKERLIKELERIANILVRHEELFMEIQEQAE